MRGPARTALAAYDLPAVKLTASPRGLNMTFRVDAAEGGRYVLRVQRPDSPSVPMARSKMTLLAALRRNTGLVVPRTGADPLGGRADRDRDPAAVPTPRSCVLYRWVEGRFMDSTLTGRHLHKVGPFTARLQSHGTATAGLAGFERGPVNTVTELGRTPPDGPSPAAAEHTAELVAQVHSVRGAGVVRAVFERVRQIQESLGRGPEVYGLVIGFPEE